MPARLLRKARFRRRCPANGQRRAEQRFAVSAGEWRGARRFAVGGARSPFPSTGAAPIAGSAFERGTGAAVAGRRSARRLHEGVPAAARRGGEARQADQGRQRPQAAPDEACKLIGNFGQAEIKMIKYVESNAAKCGIPPQVAEQMKTGHKNTEGMQKKVCAVAQQVQQRGPAGPSLSEVLGSRQRCRRRRPSKKGGSTFDTLNGNVLTR